MYGVVRLPVTIPRFSCSDSSTTKSVSPVTPKLAACASRHAAMLTSGVLHR
jgi:hypothetical protein